MKYASLINEFHPTSPEGRAGSGRQLNEVVTATIGRGNLTLGENDNFYPHPAVDPIRQSVFAALRYPNAKRGYTLDPAAKTVLESAGHNQVTNCLGYAVVGSECLSAAEDTVGPHFIMFANSHVTTAFATETARGRRWVTCDFLSPLLCTDITSGLDRPVTTILAQVNDPKHPRSVLRLDSRVFAREGHSTETLASKHPWLFIGNTDELSGMRRWSHENNSQRFSLVASVYTAEQGRRVIEQYVGFRHAVATDDTAAALTTLHELRGMYPEIDARAKHQEIKRLVGLLSLRGQATEAVTAIGYYTESFYRSQDPRLEALEAGLYTIAATATADTSLAKLAVAGYESAASRSSHPWAPVGWRSAAGRLRSRFGLRADPTYLTPTTVGIQ